MDVGGDFFFLVPDHPAVNSKAQTNFIDTLGLYSMSLRNLRACLSSLAPRSSISCMFL